MEKSITNTLFRFVTLRAPERLENEENYSIRSSIPEDSVIVSEINSVAITSEKERVFALKRAAENYKNTDFIIKDKATLISLVGEDLYSFSMWLRKERNTSSEEEIAEKVREVANIPRDREVTILWDNLFLQMITKTDTTLRENIQRIISAVNLRKKIDELEFKGKTKELANAKIVAPTFFSKIELTEKSSGKKATVNDLFQKETSLNYANIHLQHLESLEKELELIQKSYDKANTIAKKNYDSNFENETKRAYERATKVTKKFIDPLTNEEVTYYVYEDLELPEYNFEPIDELNISSYYKGNLSQSLNDIQDYFVEDLYLTTLEDLKKLLIEDKIKTNDIVFKYADLNITNRVGEGGVVYKGVNNNITSSSGTFNLLSAGTHETKILYIMLFGIPQVLDVIKSEYKVTFTNGTSIEKSVFYMDMMATGILKIDIFNTFGNYFNPDIEYLNFTFEATFNCTNNQKLTLTGSADITRSSLVIDDPGSGQQNPGHSMYPNTDFMHNDGWDTLNFPTMAPFKVMSDIGFSSRGRNPNNFNVSGNGTYQLVTVNPDDAESEGDNNDEVEIEKYGLKRLGIADYRRVEQDVCCYVPGEVSHIENIMAREYKERTTRRLRRSEETLTSTKEREIENLTDTTTTERFEMNQEIYQMTTQQNSLGVQGGLSWNSRGAGPSGFINTDMAYSSSKDNSNTQAVNYAKEVTERALERVVNKVKEERITKIIDEFSEENIHGFDNKKGVDHVSGVYRWVDKIYENRVINYGKRLMYEFAIPEPAAFHRFAMDRKNTTENDLVEPKDPRIGDGKVKIETSADITETNYHHWAGIYNAEIMAPPSKFIYVSGGFTDFGSSGNYIKEYNHTGAKSFSVDIPENYKAISYNGSFGFAYVRVAYEQTRGILTIGKNKGGSHDIFLTNTVGANKTNSINGNLDGIINKLEAGFYGIDVGAVSVSLEVKCERTSEIYYQWQIDVFNAIITAYEEKLREYNEKKEQLKALQKEKSFVNPLFYREIENTMLKKSCMEYFLKNEQIGIEALLISDTHNVRANYTNSSLGSYADRVKFLEQAFEWDIMSYSFYPFYWAEKRKWLEYYTTECDDPLFKSFLQSGMARVIVTVRPGFEETVNWFLETGEVWSGEEAPTINDPLFKDIIDELEVIEGQLEKTWQSRVPTSLTVLQAGSIGLDVQGLPCDDDCGDYGFDSDGKTLNPIKQTNNKIGGEDQPA